MPKIERILAEVERLVDTVKPREAEERLRALIGTMGDDELRTWEADVRLTIGRFLPKRRKSLLLVLDQRLAWPDGAPSPPRPAQPEPELDYDRLASAFAGDLRDLSEHHMFQWSTFYRDVLSFYFDRFLGAATNAPDQEVLHLIREPL